MVVEVVAACAAVGLVAVWGMCRASLEFVERIERRERGPSDEELERAVNLEAQAAWLDEEARKELANGLHEMCMEDMEQADKFRRRAARIRSGEG